MNSHDNLICKDFENEIWLFVEGGLPEAQTNFWKKHLEQCPACSSLIDKNKVFLNSCKEELSCDLLDSKFETIINNAVQTKPKFILNKISFDIKAITIRTKVALLSGLAVVAIIVSLITPRQNPVKTVSSGLLDWEGEKINSQLESIEQKIETISNDKWSNEIRSIDEQLQKLEIHVDKF